MWGFCGCDRSLSLGVSGIWYRTSQHKVGKCAYVYDYVLKSYIFCSVWVFGSVTDLSLLELVAYGITSLHKLGKCAYDTTSFLVPSI